MSVTDEDLQRFAARIRPHFEAGLRDIAAELALGIARCVGVKAKLLRPETTLDQIFDWFHTTEPFPASLDQVEWVMALEMELGIDVPDAQASKPDVTSFRDLVLIRARKRRVA